MTMHHLLEPLRGALIVSVQVHRADDPLRGPAIMAAIARAAVEGGAAGIRCGGIGGLPDVEAVCAAVDVPVIGLWKDGDTDVYITPSVDHAVAVAAAGASIVAIDGTARVRPDGSTFADAVRAVHAAGALVLADVSTEDEALAAEAAGADAVATTLAGYTPGRTRTPGPDLVLVERLAARITVPVIAEGRYHRPADAAAAITAGAHAVVVGTAITVPAWITTNFREALPRR
ncbi:N-acetylmannosamine-6-phosphate 2-epimerase [Embleya hyalina]|uniref:N-acylglucosamine-6-phosphate 2-epimerase n=1 Tax=Embleya hyalina TaxID=516124 RepID=A0A401YET4_9ACTN|nr:putative N-acetylmannosamine-6-phosphate 2-epimerase [Embleya hyalina]GCD93121.1 putative N-acetylmannosamine-6-phosphate 2-epimerase [Embleya hyalina]